MTSGDWLKALSAQALLSITAAAVTAGRKRKYTVKLVAKQKRSGMSAVQFSPRRSGGQTVVLKDRKKRGYLKLRKSVSVRATKRPKFIRVQSAAGTWSKWKAIKRR